MLHANELMVGDLILVNGRPTRVYGIMERQRRIYDTMTNDISLKRCDPMPLTPEILEKNGFVYNAIPFVDGWEQFGLTLYRGGNGYRIDCGINVSLIIDCVHELQHCLKLVGIEKEITL